MIVFRGKDVRFFLDLDEGQIRRGEERIHLPRKDWEVLVYLANHPKKLISKSTLLEKLWPDVSVGDENIARAISNLRRVLGDEAKHSSIIETVPRRGYRFIASIEQNIDNSVVLSEPLYRTRVETIDSLRNRLGQRVTPILTALWNDIEEPGSTTDPGLLFDQFGEEAALACLSIHQNPLLRRNMFSAFSITLLGAHLTQYGQHIEGLLIRYVGFIRNKHAESKYRLKEIKSSELKNDLKLTSEEMDIMWKLWGIPCPFFGGGSGSREKWSL